ncbi:MAG: type II secretion system protein N [Pseudomonadota bacterium]
MSLSSQGARQAGRIELPFLASVLGAMFCGLAAVELFLASSVSLQSDAMFSEAGDDSSESLSADSSVLQSFNLFGGDVLESSGASDYEDLPVTTLSLILRSATPSVGGVSRAIIQLPNGNQNVVVEGEEIMSGVVLEHVETWRARINRRGSREVLILENRPEIKETMPAEDASSAEGVDDLDKETAALIQSEPLAVGPNLAELAGPFMAQLEGHGFSPTDVPLAVNGQPLPSDANQLEAMILQARNAEAVTVTVQRDGRREDIEFSLLPAGEF